MTLSGIYNDLLGRQAVREFTAEFLATMVLIMFGDGVVAQVRQDKMSHAAGGQPTWQFVLFMNSMNMQFRSSKRNESELEGFTQKGNGGGFSVPWASKLEHYQPLQPLL